MTKRKVAWGRLLGHIEEFEPYLRVKCSHWRVAVIYVITPIKRSDILSIPFECCILVMDLENHLEKAGKPRDSTVAIIRRQRCPELEWWWEARGGVKFLFFFFFFFWVKFPERFGRQAPQKLIRERNMGGGTQKGCRLCLRRGHVEPGSWKHRLAEVAHRARWMCVQMG